MDEESQGFMLSGDKNFRPTDAIFGEDGALYVSDWQNVIIGHMQHNVRDQIEIINTDEFIGLATPKNLLKNQLKLTDSPSRNYSIILNIR